MMVNTLQILFLTESLLITSSGLFAGHVPRAFLTPNATPNYLGRMMGMSACGTKLPSGGADQCPKLGAERTQRGHAATAESDPKPT
jgi:hypothetical protein